MKYWLSCLLCGLKTKLNKDGYCKVCQDINDAIDTVRKKRSRRTGRKNE